MMFENVHLGSHRTQTSHKKSEDLKQFVSVIEAAYQTPHFGQTIEELVESMVINHGDYLYGREDPREGYFEELTDIHNLRVDYMDSHTEESNLSAQDYTPVDPYESPAGLQVLRYITDNEKEGNFKPITQAELSRDLRVSRTCKSGIEWIVQSKRTCIFCLDDLDIDMVLQDVGNKTEKVGLDKEGGFTGRELRRIYRTWDDTINGEPVKDHIIFVKDYKVVDPPWVTDPIPWAAYLPKSWKPLKKTVPGPEGNGVTVSKHHQRSALKPLITDKIEPSHQNKFQTSFQGIIIPEENISKGTKEFQEKPENKHLHLEIGTFNASGQLHGENGQRHFSEDNDLFLSSEEGQFENGILKKGIRVYSQNPVDINAEQLIIGGRALNKWIEQVPSAP